MVLYLANVRMVTMTIAYFLHVDGPPGRQNRLQSWADEVFGPALNSSYQGGHIEAFAPQTIDDPYLANETGKLLIVQANFTTADQLETAMAHSAVAEALAIMPADSDFRVTAEAFAIKTCPLSDGSTPPRRAALSFVIRYYRPIEEEQLIIDHYIAHHPPIMAHFPRIRNVLCYVSIDWQDANNVAPSNSYLGNEIVFDNIEDLNAALISDARHDLRTDFLQFPSHAGESTHFAMLRRVLFPAPAD